MNFIVTTFFLNVFKLIIYSAVSGFFIISGSGRWILSTYGLCVREIEDVVFGSG